MSTEVLRSLRETGNSSFHNVEKRPTSCYVMANKICLATIPVANNAVEYVGQWKFLRYSICRDGRDREQCFLNKEP